MTTPLAWKNIVHARVRALGALCGISFAVLLVFMQLGFYDSARDGATLIYGALDFDLVLLSPQYSNNTRPGTFPRSRLEQIRAVPGVGHVTPLWLGLGDWRNPQTRHAWDMLLVGIETGDHPFREFSLNDQLALLAQPGSALIDRRSRPEFGHDLDPGTVAEINGRRVELRGGFKIGTSYFAGSTTLLSRQTFARVVPGYTSDRLNLGLVKLAPGASPEAVRQSIAALVAPESVVYTRAGLIAREQHYWLNTKPVGIMFTSGVIVAVVIGAFVLYQVLASEVQNRLRDYATLKALGYGDTSVYGVVLRQGLLLAGLGFLPACGLAAALYYQIHTRLFLPVEMEWRRTLVVLGLTGLMAVFATFFAVRKLRAADPADLF
jgi:putative ABC transport system permease protein